MPSSLTLQSLPLFPLGAVLFPDGVLTLRIFEVRYLDMIGRCQDRKPILFLPKWILDYAKLHVMRYQRFQASDQRRAFETDDRVDSRYTGGGEDVDGVRNKRPI